MDLITQYIPAKEAGSDHIAVFLFLENQGTVLFFHQFFLQLLLIFGSSRIKLKNKLTVSNRE